MSVEEMSDWELSALVKIKDLEAKNKQQEKLLIEACEEIRKFARSYPITIRTNSFLSKPEIKELLERKDK